MKQSGFTCDLAEEYNIDLAMGDPLDAIDAAMDRVCEEAEQVMLSDEIYDLLQDDYIIAVFTKALRERVNGLKKRAKRESK